MEFKVGTMLILEPMYTETYEKFRCKVVETAEGIIYIDYPVNTATKKTAFLMDGSQFRATFNNEAKQSFAFTTEVIGRKAGNIPMIMLHCPPKEEFIKIQRREFVRVETPVDVAIEKNGNYYQYVTDDISAGGILINVTNGMNFAEGDNVNLLLVLSFANREIYYVNTIGHAVRIFEKDNKKLASIQFNDADDVDKQQIVRFCFERQLQKRRKETELL